MFQFSGLSLDPVNRMGCPIRISTDQNSSAVPRSFSQLGTSFFVSDSLGIPRTPLVTYLHLKYPNCSFFAIVFSSNMSKNFCKPLFTMWRITDSNRWPPACKAGALASWANSPKFSLSVSFVQQFFSCSLLPLLLSVVPPRFELGTSTLSV